MYLPGGDKVLLGEIITHAGINSTSRPETLTLEDYARLTDCLIDRTYVSK